MENEKRAFGAIFSPPDVRDYKLVCAGTALPDFPKEFQLETRRVKNQGNVGSCHDDKTEVLTHSGWKFFKDITYEDELASVEPDSGILIFEHPVDILKYEYNGPMIVGKHQSLDFKVTPNHKMVVRKSYKTKLEEKYSFIEASKLTYWTGLRTEFHYHNETPQSIIFEEEKIVNGNILPRLEIPMGLWVQLIGIYLAEGTMYKDPEKYHYRIQLAAVKDREKNYIKNLLKEIGINGINEQKDRFHFCNKRIWKKFEEYGLLGVKSYDKFIPEFIFNLDEEYIKLFLYGFAMGDGNFRKDGTINFYTSSVKLAEQLHILNLMSGKYGIIITETPEQRNKKSHTIKGREIITRHNAYTVTQWKKPNLSIMRKKDINVENYTGFVYCATVPTYHTLITRRNGYVLLSGNCVAHALSEAMEYYNYKQNKDDTELAVGFIYGNRRNSKYKGEGLIVRDALGTIKKYGNTSKELFPYNKEVPDIIDLFEKQADALTPTAYPHHITEYVRLNDENSIKLALLAGFPVPMAMTWYNDMKVDKNGVLHSNFREKDYAGGHCMLLTGWDENGWRIQNSWGEDWGINGKFTLPYEYPMEEAWAIIDEEVEGIVIKKPYQTKAGKWFAKIVNKVRSLF